MRKGGDIEGYGRRRSPNGLAGSEKIRSQNGIKESIYSKFEE
jgi:hypothetical protein